MYMLYTNAPSNIVCFEWPLEVHFPSQVGKMGAWKTSLMAVESE